MALKTMALIFSELVKQKNIDLTGKGLGDGDLGVLVRVLQKSRVLKTLYLEDNEIHFSDDEFANALAGNRTLECLGLDENKIGAAGVGRIARALQANSTLESLFLGGNEITLSDNEFTDAIAASRTLKVLGLYSNKIDNEGAERLARALKANNALEELDLGGNQINDQGAKNIASALAVNKSLKVISLGGNAICDEGAKSLADCFCMSNRSLCHMYLDQNKIGDRGAQSFATSLVVNQSLRRLYLDGNVIGDEGAERLADALECNHILEYLNLEANPITNIVLTDNIDTMLADPSRKDRRGQMSSLDQMEKFHAKKDAKIAALKTELANPVKQLEKMLTAKDARIAALEASRKNSLPIVETLDLTGNREVKRPRTQKYAVVGRAELNEQRQRLLRVKRETNGGAAVGDGAQE